MLIVVAFIGVAALALGLGLFNPSTEQLNVDEVERELQAQLTEQVGTGVAVRCPEPQPLKKGAIFDCVADDGKDRFFVRITQDDDQGHYRWELTSQRVR